MRGTTIIAVLFLMLCGSFVAPDGWAEPEKKAKVAKKADKKVCKKVKTTGSHFKKRVCMKQSRWDAMAREAQEGARGMMDRTSSNSGA